VSLNSPPNTVYCADLGLSWPKTMYTEQGRQMGERLWDETLEELKFAGVRERL
jgi:hypothetical protein